MPKYKENTAPYISPLEECDFFQRLVAEAEAMPKNELHDLEIFANFCKTKGEHFTTTGKYAKHGMRLFGHLFAWDINREMWVLYAAHQHDGTRFNNFSRERMISNDCSDSKKH